jgi:hypothetical protein
LTLLKYAKIICDFIKQFDFSDEFTNPYLDENDCIKFSKQDKEVKES